MGELSQNIFVIGSPDIDILKSGNLPKLNEVKNHYAINFENYAIGVLHSVTTDIENTKKNSKVFVQSILNSKKNFVIIYPNNDNGSKIILEEYKKFLNKKRIRILPSMRFEYYLSLLKNSNLIVGNSSSGIMEAPYYGVPTINLGNRQNKRSNVRTITNMDFNKNLITKKIDFFFKKKIRYKKSYKFGAGNSAIIFKKILKSGVLWKVKTQKVFSDR